MSEKKHVIVVQDNNTKNKAYIDLVRRRHDVTQIDINDVSRNNITQTSLIIVQVNLNDPNVMEPLKILMAMPERSHIPTLFLLTEFSRREIVQANTLGATDYTIYPCEDGDFLQTMEKLLNTDVAKAWEKLSLAQEEALKISLKVVEKTFHNASKGLEVSQVAIKDSCSLIIEATAKDGLTDWMNVIRLYHDYTYRHSMMVCGYLVSFGMLLEVKKSDLQMLAVGGMMHDIGKSLVPLAILDSPEKLTPAEQKILANHPAQGQLILERENWDPEIIDIAAHHHENLDGSGYPDGLKGPEISDIVRLVSIANIFSNLTDKRPFKVAMTAEKAIEHMLAMTDHLDIPLVKSFRAVVLSEEDKNFAQP
ncbi:MAG: HD domain-containing protein [Emcibacter sp.]|nr:HD domain-containing protein [Emcibacter sp.]